MQIQVSMKIKWNEKKQRNIGYTIHWSRICGFWSLRASFIMFPVHGQFDQNKEREKEIKRSCHAIHGTGTQEKRCWPTNFVDDFEYTVSGMLEIVMCIYHSQSILMCILLMCVHAKKKLTDEYRFNVGIEMWLNMCALDPQSNSI